MYYALTINNFKPFMETVVNFNGGYEEEYKMKYE